MTSALPNKFISYIEDKNFEELERYISESDKGMQFEMCLDLFSLAENNDEILNFLLKMSTGNIEEFKYSKILLFANLLVSSCKTSGGIKWIIKKIREHNLDHSEVVKEAIQMFGCGEVENIAPLLLKMLAEVY